MPQTSVYFDKLLADLRLSKYKLYELVVCSDSDEDFPDNPDFLLVMNFYQIRYFDDLVSILLNKYGGALADKFRLPNNYNRVVDTQRDDARPIP